MREQRAREIKEEFLNSAFNYLINHGLENTSIRDLCKGTGISVGSLYYWFDGGKDEIYISAAKYGLAKVADELFKFAFENMHDLRGFFDVCLEEIAKHKLELRLIYQIATSPVYGGRMRDAALDLNSDYEKYIKELADTIDFTPDLLTPNVYIFISIVLDYAVWDDYEVTKKQLEYLYSIMSVQMQFVKATKN